jgi:cytochrome b pre-mRNA-processing protein 3
LFSRFRSPKLIAADLYAGVVAAARAPAFYAELQVPDTVEGRYEMIVLHVVLLLRRMRQPGAGQKRLSQAVVDFMAADLDRSIRELGVGDMSVGKFMKRLGEGLYGRAAVYDKALDDRDIPALETAILRNIFDGYEPDDGILATIAYYVQGQHDYLAGQPIEEIVAGTVDFQSPYEIKFADMKLGTEISRP